MHDAQKLKICSIFKERKCANKIFSCHTLQYTCISYLGIYRLFNVKQLNKTSNRSVTHTSYKMHENRCVLLEIYMHVRPMRFTALCTPTDSSDKTRLICSNPIGVFYYVGQVGWTTVPCQATKLSLLISKSFVGIKQIVISVALKTPLKKIGNLYLQNFTSASARRLYWFYIKLSPPHFTKKFKLPPPNFTTKFTTMIFTVRMISYQLSLCLQNDGRSTESKCVPTLLQ